MISILPMRACTDEKLTDSAFRVLGILCSYCNRAGITWVSQTRLAQDMRVSQQAISKQFKQLRDLGYLEIVRQGFKGERTATLRVIYNPDITAEEAVAMTSNIEDTRSPAMREEQEKKQQEPVNQAGLNKIAQLVAGALKQPQPKEKHMPKPGTSRLVKQMHKDIQEAKSKRSKQVQKPVDNSSTFTTSEVVQPQVVNEPSIHNSITTSEVVCITENIDIRREVKDSYRQPVQIEKADWQQLLISMKPEQAVEIADEVIALFQAEGINPSSRVLTQTILQVWESTSRANPQQGTQEAAQDANEGQARHG